MAKGDTFGDTFRVAKQVRGCQNLGEIQANTTDNPLPERAIYQVSRSVDRGSSDCFQTINVLEQEFVLLWCG